MRWLIYYLIIINIVCFVLYGIDKILAKKRRNRISERCLFFFGFLGGGLGGLLGMFAFRHKTKKMKFYVWNIIWITIWLYLCIKYIFSS